MAGRETFTRGLYFFTSGREIFTSGLYVFNLWRETLAGRVGVGIGATIGAGIGAGKHHCNSLILRLGVRGVTKLQSCMYTRARACEALFGLHRTIRTFMDSPSGQTKIPSVMIKE